MFNIRKKKPEKITEIVVIEFGIQSYVTNVKSDDPNDKQKILLKYAVDSKYYTKSYYEIDGKPSANIATYSGTKDEMETIFKFLVANNGFYEQTTTIEKIKIKRS